MPSSKVLAKQIVQRNHAVRRHSFCPIDTDKTRVDRYDEVVEDSREENKSMPKRNEETLIWSSR